MNQEDNESTSIISVLLEALNKMNTLLTEQNDMIRRIVDKLSEPAVPVKYAETNPSQPKNVFPIKADMDKSETTLLSAAAQPAPAEPTEFAESHNSELSQLIELLKDSGKTEK